MGLIDTVRMDRQALEIARLGEEPDDVAYWRSRPPEERMIALELLRQIFYGYDPATERLQRVLEVVDLK